VLLRNISNSSILGSRKTYDRELIRDSVIQSGGPTNEGTLLPNKAALAACRDAAAKTKKEQHCVLVVPAPMGKLSPH
jgi:hypothetical protein